MRIYIIQFIISLVDFFYKLKIKNFLKKKRKKFNIFIDVGAHHGESINFFLKNFKVKTIYSFEPSPINFETLEEKCLSLKKKFKNSCIIIENLGLSNVSNKIFLRQFKESSSSTLNRINNKSLYYKKKNNILYSNNKNLFKKIEVKIVTLKDYLNKNKIKKIDFLKIDTEGYEYKVILGLKDYLSKVNLIMFEHHYDNMIIKNYNFSKIHNLLIKNKFKKIFKIRMPLRKTFEYIYENNQHSI
jgi:FkbM family methyltransferase